MQRADNRRGQYYFNPRAPHGARHESCVPCILPGHISIHALRMERDAINAPTINGTKNFNPRAPHGARPIVSPGLRSGRYFNPRAPHGARPFPLTARILSMRFQSTRSAWSATNILRWETPIYDISIHALRMERDCFPRLCSDWHVRFQSTRSAWSATHSFPQDITTTEFQSTRSAWSATGFCYRMVQEHMISIHALRMERDLVSLHQPHDRQDFNPRAPHGARQTSLTHFCQSA